MSSLFQHFTCGFQQLSKDFTTNSYQVQTYAKNSTTVFQATAQPISAFPLVCNHCSAYFSSLPRVFMHFFHFQDWFSSFFFFRSLSHQLSSLCHCFSLFMFIHFYFVITCYPFGIVFTWPLLWYICSSILIICNCFIFRFHHISCIYLPLPKYFVSKRSENSLKKIIKPAMQNPYISFDTANAILDKKIPELVSAGNNVCYADCVSYFVSALCHGTTVHPATKGGKWEGLFNNSRAQDPHSGWSRRGTAQGGERVGGWGFVTISKYFIDINIYICIYVYIYICIYMYIYIDVYLSFKQIKCISRNLYTYKTGGSLKVRSTEKYLCQFCLINQPWKSKLPPSGETREWWNLGTLKPNKSGVPQLKEMACYPWFRNYIYQ